jgi:2-amino-4-hydroxy-6-hydroxymethyldihydropteridine diphosphokinase
LSAAVSAFIALGGNLDDPATQLRHAAARLAADPRLRLSARSGLWRSPPMGPPGQPEYLNAVLRVETALAPEGTLALLLETEAALGRRRDGPRWGPRLIDLDLLWQGEARCSTPALRLPHPGIAERAFVLKPLAEIAADEDVPGLGRVSELLARVDGTGVERIGEL